MTPAPSSWRASDLQRGHGGPDCGSCPSAPLRSSESCGRARKRTGTSSRGIPPRCCRVTLPARPGVVCQGGNNGVHARPRLRTPGQLLARRLQRGGRYRPAVAQITLPTPPAITSFRAQSSYLTSPRRRTTPAHSKGGLTFSYTLNQRAEVLYVLYRRDRSPQRRQRPKSATGHTRDTFTHAGSLTGSGDEGSNAVVIASSKSVRGGAAKRTELRRTMFAGRHCVTLAAITANRAHALGTSVVIATATNAKCFALADHSARPSAAR